MATAGRGRGAGPERAFLVPLPDCGPVALRGEEAHHLVRVRRAEPGDEVVLFDGLGGTRLARLVAATREEVTLEVTGPYPDREPRREVTIAVALPAAGRADELIADLAEMGVTVVIPLACERSAPDTRERNARRADRFDRLAREAAKVNGRSRVLRVEETRAFRDALPRPGASRAILLDPDSGLSSLSHALAGLPGPVLLIVGPEGGFSAAEVEEAAAAGVALATLGACALRVETAARAAGAIALCP